MILLNYFLNENQSDGITDSLIQGKSEDIKKSQNASESHTEGKSEEVNYLLFICN